MGAGLGDFIARCFFGTGRVGKIDEMNPTCCDCGFKLAGAVAVRKSFISGQDIELAGGFTMDRKCRMVRAAAVVVTAKILLCWG